MPFPVVQREVKQRPRQSQITVAPTAIHQRHITELVLFVGLSTDRPDGTTEVKFWFSTDTNELSVFNTESESWLSTTLT